MNGIKEYVGVWKDIVNAKIPLLLIGQVGIGKTEIWKDIGREEGREVIITHLARSSNTDFIIPIVEEGTIKYSTHELFNKLEKGNCIWLLDEYDRADGLTRNAILSCLNERIFNDKRISEDTWIVLLANQENSKDTNFLNEAEITRCAKFNLNDIFELNNLDNKSQYFINFIEVATRNKVEREIISFLFAYPNYLFKKEDESGQFATPRNWTNLSKVYKKIALIGDKEKENNIISSFVGTKAAEKFLIYTKIYGKLPSAEEILKWRDGDVEKLSSDERIATLDILYQYGVENNNEQERIMKFINDKLGKEYINIYILNYATAQGKEKTSKVFLKLINENKDIKRIILELFESL
jgi:uncharacterized protein YeaC (DUF1315 family)